jgi:hypothetical protein
MSQEGRPTGAAAPGRDEHHVAVPAALRICSVQRGIGDLRAGSGTCVSVMLSPSWMRRSAFEISRACASVLA